MVFSGSQYGGWWYDRQVLNSAAIIYSFGLGEDTTWDEEMSALGAHVYGFDPTPKAIKYVRERRELHIPSKRGSFYFTPKGLSTQRGKVEFTKPLNPSHVSARQGNHAGLGEVIEVEVDTLRNFMSELGHKHIDILKMDVEGSEYDVLDAIIAEKFFPFSQLLVEFHQRFDGVDLQRHQAVLAGLLLNGFYMTHNRNDQEISFQKLASNSSNSHTDPSVGSPQDKNIRHTIWKGRPWSSNSRNVLVYAFASC